MKHLLLDENTKMAEDESWLDEEIQKELDAINSAELEAPDDIEEPHTEDYDEVSSEDEALPLSIMDYLIKVKVQTEKVQHELEECDTVLEETSVVCHKKHFQFDEDLQQIAQEEGIDVQTLTERVITELDKEDVDDEKLAATNSRNNAENSSEKLHNPESHEHLCIVSSEEVDEYVLQNTETQKTTESKKIETIDLNETDATSCSKEQTSEHTEPERVENADSSDGQVTEANNNPNTEFTKESISDVVTCVENSQSDAGSNHDDAGCNHSNVGSNHGDAGSNHDDAGSNHGDARSIHDDKTSMEDKSEFNENAENHENGTEETVPLLPEEGVLVVVSDSELLERQLLLEVTVWDHKRRTTDKLRQQEEIVRRQEEECRVQEIEELREQKRQENLEEEQRLIQQRERTEAEVRKEVEEREKQKEEVQECFKQQQSQIDLLIEETRAERDQLEQAVKEQTKSQEQKKLSAATKIQATFRRFQARLRYGALVEEKREAVRETLEAERVRVVEQQIEARNREEDDKKQKVEEERRERERKKEEEAKVKAELEKKKKEEKARKKKEENEKRKQEEEERRQAEEEKKLMEKQRKQEAKQKKIEEAKKKKEEERQRKEALAERKKEEQDRREEEKRRKEELVRSQEEELRTQRGGKKSAEDEQLNQVEKKDEEGPQHLDTDDERQPQNVDPVKPEEEETKTQEDQLKKDEEKQDEGEEEEDKQEIEQLRTEDTEKKKIEEEVIKKELGIKQETGDEDEGDKKESGEDSGVQKEEGIDRVEGEADKQQFEKSYKTAKDFEQLPKTEQLPQLEQDFKQTLSGDTVADTEHLAQTAKDSEQKNVQKMDSVKTSDRSSSCYVSAPKDWGDYLPEPIDNKRVAWIKDCLPWSKIAGAVKMRPGRGSSKKPPRRPSSAKTLEPLADVRLLSATGTMSLQKITTVQLTDLPGCSLSTLGQCVHLKAVSLNHCGVVTVEGLEPCSGLTYLDLQHNKIEYVAPLKASKSLMYVNLAHNCLSTIHGLEECANIRYLDLSHNRITRLGGLGDLRRLHTLQLQNNQLISSHCIGELITLQNLDLSHNLLPRLDNLQHLALLQVFSASSNNLLQVPELSNHVLLRQLLLHDNSISSVRNISQGWCPLLQQLDLSKNRVSLLADLSDLSSCLLLDTLDLKDNQIADLSGLVTFLATMRMVESLDLSGCPVCQEADYRTAMAEVLPTLCSLDGALVSSCCKLEDRTEFEEMCLSHVQQETSLRNSHEAALEKCSSVVEKSQVHKRYFDRSFQLAVKHRQSHEYGEVTIDPNTSFDLNPTAMQPKKMVSQTADMKALFDEAVRNNAQASAVTNIPRPPSGGRPKDLASRPQSHLVVEKTVVLTPTANESCRRMLTYEDKAAIKIQALWRGHNLRHKIDYYTRKAAAMTIQACWRGYFLRKRLHMAMDYVRFGDDDSDSVYGEVNMDDFDFSEADLEKGWTPPATPQLPQNHPVLGPTPSSHPDQTPTVPPLYMHSPFPPDQPRQAWRNPDSPFSQTGYRGGRVPLEPLSEPSEIGLTQRTALSKKEEQLTEEWGFKDSRTAELMLQRAKKLKYNTAKKKKLSKLDPQQRLALLRKLEQPPQVVHPPTRRIAPRMEYFKGRILVEEKRAKQDIVKKQERMFEWLHTQVGNFDVTSSRINKHLNSGGRDRPDSSHNLPLLDPGVLAGAKAQLMGSPNSLENHSVFEGSSGEVPQPLAIHRRLSMQDDYSRGQLPQIKTTSAPVIRVKEKMSWRNKNNTRTSGGWGGGRKRSKPA